MFDTVLCLRGTLTVSVQLQILYLILVIRRVNEVTVYAELG